MYLGLLFVTLFALSLLLIYHDKWLCTLDAFFLPPIWRNELMFLSLTIIRIGLKYGSILGIGYIYGWLFGIGAFVISTLFGHIAYFFHCKKTISALTNLWLDMELRENPHIDPYQAYLDANSRASKYVSSIRYPGDMPNLEL